MHPVIESLAEVVAIQLVDQSLTPEVTVTMSDNQGGRQQFRCPLADSPQVGQQVTITYSWWPQP